MILLHLERAAVMGCVGVASWFFSGWVKPMAVAGMIFYGFAGINHTFVKSRNAHETTALVSNLFVSIVLLIAILN